MNKKQIKRSHTDENLKHNQQEGICVLLEVTVTIKRASGNRRQELKGVRRAPPLEEVTSHIKLQFSYFCS